MLLITGTAIKIPVLSWLFFLPVLRAADPHSFFADPEPVAFSKYGSGSSWVITDLDKVLKNTFMKQYLLRVQIYKRPKNFVLLNIAINRTQIK